MKTSSLVPDDLWEAIEPLLPKELPKPKGGRPRVAARAVLGGIIFVLRTGCPWRLLPKGLGCGSGTTCWRRLRDWQAAGVWERLHTKVLNWLGDEASIDWSRASVDSLSVRAKRGASRPGRTPQIAASPAPNITWWWIGRVSPWLCASRRPTPTMRLSCSRSSTRFPRSLGRGADQDDRASAQPSCTPTKPTTRPLCAAPCAPATSRLGLLVAPLTPASDWAGTVGSWSERSPGCSAFAASACATSDGPISSKAFCTSPAP
jgi:transposase